MLEQITQYIETLRLGMVGYIVENWIWIVAMVMILGFAIDQTMYFVRHKPWRRWMHNLRVCRRFIERRLNIKLSWPPDIAQPALAMEGPDALEAPQMELDPLDEDAPVVVRKEKPKKGDALRMVEAAEPVTKPKAEAARQAQRAKPAAAPQALREEPRQRADIKQTAPNTPVQEAPIEPIKRQKREEAAPPVREQQPKAGTQQVKGEAQSRQVSHPQTVRRVQRQARPAPAQGQQEQQAARPPQEPGDRPRIVRKQIAAQPDKQQRVVRKAPPSQNTEDEND